jgi:hypothetical protein
MIPCERQEIPGPLERQTPVPRGAEDAVVEPIVQEGGDGRAMSAGQIRQDLVRELLGQVEAPVLGLPTPLPEIQQDLGETLGGAGPMGSSLRVP